MLTEAEARRLPCPFLSPWVIVDYHCHADAEMCDAWRDDGDGTGDCFYLKRERKRQREEE